MAKLLMTLDELIEKAGEGDPLYTEAEQLEKVGDKILLIYGHNNYKGYADDLMITINENSLTLHYKAPASPDKEWKHMGTTCEECPDACECVNGWAYSL